MLKKNSKKKIIFGSTLVSLATGVASIIIPNTINNDDNNSVLQKSELRAIQNAGYTLTSDGTVLLGSKQSTSYIVNETNPNIAKSIKNGYIIPMKKGNDNLLVCVDQNNPTNILWSSNFGPNCEILATEYLSGTRDKVVVLYRDGGDDFNNGLTVGTDALIKVRVISSASTINDGSNQNGSDTIITQYTYDNSSKYNSRADLWSLVPVFYYGPSDDAGNEFMIFQKHWNNNKEQTVFVFDSSSLNVQETVNLDWTTPSDQEEAILSAEITRYGNYYYMMTLKAINNGNNTILKAEATEFKFVDNGNSWAFGSQEIASDSNIFKNGYSSYSKLDIIKSSLSEPSVYFNDSAWNHTTTFVVNAPCLDGGNVPFRGSYFAIVNWDAKEKVNNGEGANIISVKRTPMFATTIAYSEGSELWNGYVNNAPVIRNGLSVTSQTNSSTPLYANGYSNKYSGTRWSKFFSATIKNPMNDNAANVDVDQNTNHSTMRTFGYSSTANTPKSFGYIIPNSVDNVNNFAYHLNAPAGININEFSDSADSIADPFSLNILHTANGSNNAIIINQVDRGQNSNAYASYGFYTRLSNNEFQLNYEGDDINSIDGNYINNYFSLNNNWKETKLYELNPNSFMNFRDDSIIVINTGSLVKNEDGTRIQANLYSTSAYSSTGVLSVMTLSELKNQWSAGNMIGTVVINVNKVQQKFTPTSIRENVALGQINVLPTNFWGDQNDNQKVIDLIFSNRDQFFNSLPSDFSIDNISIVSITTDNLNGNISVSLNLNNYYGNDGYLTNTQKEFSTTISGWKKQLPTKYIITGPQYIGRDNILPNDFINQSGALEQLIFNNINSFFTNLPDGLSQSNIIVSEKNPNNLTGELQVEFTINKFWNSQGVLTEDNSFGSLDLVITGFKSQQPTQLPTQGSSFGLGSSLQSPTEFYGNQDLRIQNLIFNNKEQLFKNLPSDFISTNIIVSNVVTNNLNGTIALNISINNYYNEQGILVASQNSETRSIIITGFATRNSTVFPSQNAEYNLGDISQLPTSFYANQNSTNIRNLIFSNSDSIFENLPNNFKVSNINIENVITNNVEGSITVSFNVNNWFNSEGILSNDNSQTCTIKITGFKSQQPTQAIVDGTEKEWGLNNQTPTDFIKDNNLLVGLLFDNINSLFTNLPSDFTRANIIIDQEQTRADNLNGKISVSFKINKYFDSKGILVQDSDFPDQIIIINNFKSQQPTVFPDSDTEYSFGQNGNLPSSLSETDIKKIIFSNINELIQNLPDNFDVDNINVISFTPNNLSGKLNVSFSINNWFDNQGVLSNETSQEIAVVFVGFASQQPTTFPKNNSQFAFGNDQKTASKYYNNDTNNISDLIYFNKKELFTNLPANFYQTNIFITSVVANDNEGTIRTTFYINNWINNNGVLTNEQSTSVTILITGFLIENQVPTLKPTTISQGRLEGYENQLPSQVNVNGISFKTALIPFIKDPAPGQTISASDLVIELVEWNDELGTIKINVTINNGKAANNGLVVGQKQFYNLTFTGFKSSIGAPSDDNESNNMTKIIGGVIAIVGGIILLGVVIWLVMKSRKNQQ